MSQRASTEIVRMGNYNSRCRAKDERVSTVEYVPAGDGTRSYHVWVDDVWRGIVSPLPKAVRNKGAFARWVWSSFDATGLAMARCDAAAGMEGYEYGIREPDWAREGVRGP